MVNVTAAELLKQIDVDDARDEAVLAKLLLIDPTVHLLTHTGHERVDHWARVYRIRQEHAERVGTRTHGFPDFFARLESLSPNNLLSLAAFEIADEMGLFWLDERNCLISFIIFDRRA